MAQSTDSWLLTPLASACSGMLARMLLYPVDTAKTKIQIQNQSMSSLSSSVRPGKTFSSIVSTFREEGLIGIYRGCLLSVFGTIPGFITYLTTYEKSKTFLLTNYPEVSKGWLYLLAGLSAEAVSCIFYLPTDVIKERIQAQSNLKNYWYENARDAARQILSKEGVPGLYRAYGATLMFFGPFSALYFYFYQSLKSSVCENPDKPSFGQGILLSGLAGSLAGYLVTPLELGKLRMQVQRAEKGSQGTSKFNYKNIFHAIYMIAKDEGAFSLYRGAVVRVCFSAPMTAISIGFAQYFKQAFRPMLN